IEPQVEVRVDNKLISPSDYELTYANNINIGTATITAKLKNYSQTAVNYFEIRKVKLDDDTTGSMSVQFRESAIATTGAEYTGDAIKPKLTVKWTDSTGNSKNLTEGTDYELSYKNNTKVGTATVTAKGIGNYDGSKSLTFTIKGNFNASTSKFTVPKQMYTGTALTSLTNTVVEVGGNTLKAGTDYEVKITSSDNFKENGTAEFTPKDTNLYTGTRVVTFAIGNDKTMYNVSGIANAYTYSGNSVKPEVKVTDANGNSVATTTTNVTYKNTTDGNNCVIPGTVTMNVDVKVGEETVSLDPVTYTILQKNINACSIGSAADVAYSGNANTPSIAVSSGNGLLQAGTDYTVTYQNNVEPGTARARITGKGNYTGVADVYFNIYMPQVKNFKATTQSNGKVKLTWTKPSEEFTGYRISYRPVGGTQRQVSVGRNVTSKTFSNLAAGSTYIFIMQTYTSSAGGSTAYGDAVVANAATKTETPVITLKKAGTGKIKISWKKISGASGYMVYRKRSGGTYRRVKTIKSGNTVTYTNPGLVSGRKYVYRLIAYRTVNGKRTYSAYSAAKSIKCK
nr:fibronectin type III domain-containing protein [Lachnospiraceae bacterium]